MRGLFRKSIGDADASVGNSVRNQAIPFPASPVTAPPTATALSVFGRPVLRRSNNSDGRFRPGERVAVNIPMKGDESDSLVIPRAAVLRDIHGTGLGLRENRRSTNFAANESPLIFNTEDHRSFEPRSGRRNTRSSLMEPQSYSERNSEPANELIGSDSALRFRILVVAAAIALMVIGVQDGG